MNDDRVFKALADSTRRYLLDLPCARSGQTLTELESQLAMTRFGVMKHLRVLEAAGIVVTRWSGREKLHFLNPVPIRLIHNRWIHKYAEHQRPGGTYKALATTEMKSFGLPDVVVDGVVEEADPPRKPKASRA